MGRDRFVVAYTANTLIIAEMSTGYCSEIDWQSAGNERFYFDNENVCMIFNAGEVCMYMLLLTSTLYFNFNMHYSDTRQYP